MKATMGMKAINLAGLELVISLHTQQDPLPEEWAEFVSLQASVKKKIGDDLSRVRNFVVSDGGAPNAKQREALTNAFGGKSVKVGAITTAISNPIKRGIATALSWTNPAFKVVSPDQWQEALRHLDLDPHIHTIIFELDRLQAKLPPVSTLALLMAAAKRHVA